MTLILNIQLLLCHALPVVIFSIHMWTLVLKKMKFVENSTRDQKTPMWLDSRKVRITSSRVNSLRKSNRADPNKLLNNLLYTRFKGCSATRHGQKYESVARQWFEGKTGKSVTQSGLCIHPTQTYVAASPDGLVDNDTVIEIKWPTKNLTEMGISLKCSLPCSALEGNSASLCCGLKKRALFLTSIMTLNLWTVYYHVYESFTLNICWSD